MWKRLEFDDARIGGNGIETAAASAATSTVPSLTTSSESTAITTVTSAEATEPSVAPAISGLQAVPPAPSTTSIPSTRPSTVVASQPAKPTTDDSMTVIEAVFFNANSPVTSLGFNADHTAVIVTIRADHMAEALDLKAKYGDAIELTIGWLPYPPESPPGRNRCGPPMPHASADTLGLTATATVDDATSKSGADGTGTVVITNTSATALTIQFDSGLAGYLTDSPGATIGVFSTGFAGTGLGWTVAPGASATIRLDFGTTSCDPKYGYSLPAGTYDLVVSVRIQVGPNLTEVIRTAPISITVTA